MLVGGKATLYIAQEGNKVYIHTYIVTITRPPVELQGLSSYYHVIECWFCICLSNLLSLYSSLYLNFTATFFLLFLLSNLISYLLFSYFLSTWNFVS